MGNQPSQESNETTQKYKEYIEQQQQIIEQQQRQIQQQQSLQMQQNTFHQQGGPSMPSQIYFQQQAKRQERLNKLQLNQEKEKLNPYKIIGVSKQYSELELKKAYLKKAMVHHPDKGGDEREFQKISIAYKFLLNKLKENAQSHDHNELRNTSREHLQRNTGERNINLSEKFDSDVFNRIYEENKIPEAHEDGYGNWMKEELNPKLNTENKIQGDFSKEMFHREFDRFKKEASKEQGHQIQKYQEPEVSISYRGKDSLMVLGQKKVEDFSGQSDGGLAYRDYKDAYTNSCLIDIHSVNTKGRPKSLNEEKSQRANVSYQMNSQEQQQYSLQKLREEKEEEERIERLKQYENKAFAMHDRIHQRMLGNQ